MRFHRFFFGLSAATLILAACARTATNPPHLEPVTAATHSWFPVSGSSVHALDAGAIDGPIACESCHPPAASSFAEISCTGCHEHAVALTNRLHLGVTGYTSDSAACFSCHPAGIKVAFDHAGITGQCAECHDTGTVFAALPVAGFTHPSMGTADCSACHTTASWKGATGAPANDIGDPAAAISVDTLVPKYSGPTISAVTPVTQTIPMLMKHNSPDLAASVLSNCAACHPGASAASYYPGTLHSSLSNLAVAQPTACVSCHASAAPNGFVGPLATSPARVPPSGEMKHDAVSWTNGAPTTTALVSTNCALCHAAPSPTGTSSWAVGVSGTGVAKYHTALAAASQPQPASCIDCHANSRPNTVLTSTGTTLPTNVTFDHNQADALNDCQSCHAKSAMAPFASWANGKFHLVGSATPATCDGCHELERPTSTSGWVSPNYAKTPFDYGPNAAGLTHGAGLDCALCHNGPGTGAWGSTQNWASGHYGHATTGLAGKTCIACHSTQRPDRIAGADAGTAATLLGFDHAANGTGDCFGCHQATVVAGSYGSYFNPVTNALPDGGWRGGVTYPGSTLAGGSNSTTPVSELTLNRSGPNNLVTSMSSHMAALPNPMLHIASVLPTELQAGGAGTPDNSKCWHCHTSDGTTVIKFSDGRYHDALTNFASAPDAGVVPFAQPTSKCSECHSSSLPTGIVQKAASTLQPMDHAAQFASAVTLGGLSVTSVAQADCSVCHASPGSTWSDGLFHSKIGAGQPKECVSCHYPLMADAPKADVTSTTVFAMRHRSTQLTTQACATCHTTALGKAAMVSHAATLWQTGSLHATVTPQPTACEECHAVSAPAATAPTQSSVTYTFALGGTSTNAGQWMNHSPTAVSAKDCGACHATDAKASGSAWSKSTVLHTAATPVSTCANCHGTSNGAAGAIGTKNNLPLGLTNSTKVTSAAGPTTGIPSGTLDQITHADVNVTARDCNFCHTQTGASVMPGVQGREWAVAQFHPNFTGGTSLVMNGTTGRCSNCHMNVKPTAVFAGFDHAAFNATSGTQDCSSCHSWPGTGTASTPNWLGAAGIPPYISVGGFTIPAPPAATPTTQPGINNLPHPGVAAGVACTTCHTTTAGGKKAFGYDHLSTLIATNCRSCHEAGSDLVGTVWNNATTLAAGAGDTRPFTAKNLTPTFKGNTCNMTNANHFYPVDCKECHIVPAGNGFVTTGASYVTAWKFPHTESKMTNPATCNLCHVAGGCPKG